MTRPDYIVEDAGYKTPCWAWQKWRSHKGYGKKWYEGRNRWAHRVYFEREFGVTLSIEEHLDHRCRNTSCVNPYHLEIVSNTENQRRRSRLTQTLVDEIRSLYPQMSQQRLAARFRVSRRYVRDILDGRSWVVDGTTG